MLIKRKLTQNKMDSSKRRQSHERQLPITIVPYTRVRIDYALTRYEMNIERCKSISIFFSNALQNWNAQVIERCSLFVRFFLSCSPRNTHVLCNAQFTRIYFHQSNSTTQYSSYDFCFYYNFFRFLFVPIRVE